mgnify:CR=1 FL=1
MSASPSAFNFNSITVRLELPPAPITRAPSPQFQFHKGAIRTPVISAISLEDIDFNSIKVRLELTANVFVNNAYEFQFHKGAIRTMLLMLLIRLL